MSRAIATSKACERVLDLLYPPRCGGCERRGEWFCDDCRASVVPPEEKPHSIIGVKVLVCAGAFDGPLREAIHRLKYENDRPLARPLAELVHAALQSSPHWPRLEKSAPTLIPVPLHRERERNRGYNQSTLLARELATLADWQVDESLKRVRHTHAQVGLSAKERADNVRDAFASEGAESPRDVLLLDDVFTTGATLGECVSALRFAGAHQIYIVTVARAMGDL